MLSIITRWYLLFSSNKTLKLSLFNSPLVSFSGQAGKKLLCCAMTDLNKYVEFCSRTTKIIILYYDNVYGH